MGDLILPYELEDNYYQDVDDFTDEFIEFAEAHPEYFFYVTRIGCGIAGFTDREIAPLFKKALSLKNVCLPETFVKYLL